MTEPYEYDENEDAEDTDERYVQLTRQQIRAMERDAKQARKFEGELTEARRELALNKAGLGDLTPAKQRALLANIEGDITSETARAAAEELGFITVTPTDPGPSQAEVDGHRRVASASADSTGTTADEDPISRLERTAREGGKDALLRQIEADGHLVTPAS